MRVAIASTLTASARPLALVANAHPVKATVESLVQVSVQCIWCGKDIDPNEPVIEIGGAVMHDRPCRDDFEVHVYGLDAYAGTFDDAYGLRDADVCGTQDGRVLDYSRSEDRGIIERILRIPVGVE